MIAESFNLAANAGAEMTQALGKACFYTLLICAAPIFFGLYVTANMMSDQDKDRKMREWLEEQKKRPIEISKE